ncbi:MAG: heavy-metal-associated domain-containing protein [Candidatus Hodarchaeales archaeon]|jgi:copper chaperone CopZ
MQTIKLSISGMSCGKCVSKVKTSLSSLNGVENASINLIAREADVVFNPDQINISAIIKRVESTGYGAIELNQQNS